MQQIENHTAITQTLTLEGHLVDSGELDRLEEIFTSDVVYDLSAVGVGTVEGIDQVHRAARGMAQAGVGPLAHHVTDILITDSADGETASADSKVLLVMRNGTLESVVQHDTLRCQDGVWRISHRVVTPRGAVAQETAR